MLFSDSNIVVTRREAFSISNHAGALAHGWRNGDQFVVSYRHVAQPVTEHLGVSKRSRALSLVAVQAFRRFETGHTVIQNRVFFSQFVALAFTCHHMQKFGTGQFFQILQRWNQDIQIVPINRAVIMKAEFLKQGAGVDHALDVLFGPFREIEQTLRNAQDFFRPFFCRVVQLARGQSGEIVVQCAHWRRDGHLVIVQNNQ